MTYCFECENSACPFFKECMHEYTEEYGDLTSYITECPHKEGVEVEFMVHFS